VFAVPAMPMILNFIRIHAFMPLEGD
jgi:hypothetical protein